VDAFVAHARGAEGQAAPLPATVEQAATG
jgi:hypothetical protein